MSLWHHIEQHIQRVTGSGFALQQLGRVRGGDINASSRVRYADSDYFVKINDVRVGDMFAAEAQALREIAASNTIRVPEVLCYGEHGSQCYIAMEYLSINGRADDRLLAQQLVAMHRVTSDRFGWQRDNTIGSTPQSNQPDQDWVGFWRQHRLGFQLELAARNGYGGELQLLGDRLMLGFASLFSNYTPQASMLHGDLWGGNYGGLPDGTPVIFDPAFYYGDREAEIAMTTLFGGFSTGFYQHYDSMWPLAAGYEQRKTLYNLYHVLNHLNLFGGAYHVQAIGMMKQLLAEL